MFKTRLMNTISLFALTVGVQSHRYDVECKERPIYNKVLAG